MLWITQLPMEQEERFTVPVHSGHFTISELCREFGILLKTGHKRLKRYRLEGQCSMLRTAFTCIGIVRPRHQRRCCGSFQTGDLAQGVGEREAGHAPEDVDGVAGQVPL